MSYGMTVYTEELEKTVNELQDRLTQAACWEPQWVRDKKNHLKVEPWFQDKECRIHYYMSQYIIYAYVMPVVRDNDNGKSVLIYAANTIQAVTDFQKSPHRQFTDMLQAMSWVETHMKTMFSGITIQY
jgi:hypothetical protein